MKTHNIFFKQITKLGLLLFMGLSMVACVASSEYKKTPTSKRVDISQPNVKSELLVHISKEDNYAFRLIFKYKNKEESERVFALTHGKDVNGRRTNGENTPISIDVYTIKDGQNVLVSIGGGESFPTNASGLGFSKLIYNDYLMPGDYRVVIDTKAGNPKFKDIEVELYIGLAHRPK